MSCRFVKCLSLHLVNKQYLLAKGAHACLINSLQKCLFVYRWALCGRTDKVVHHLSTTVAKNLSRIGAMPYRAMSLRHWQKFWRNIYIAKRQVFLASSCLPITTTLQPLDSTQKLFWSSNRILLVSRCTLISLLIINVMSL